MGEVSAIKHGPLGKKKERTRGGGDRPLRLLGAASKKQRVTEMKVWRMTERGGTEKKGRKRSKNAGSCRENLHSKL